MTRPRDSASSVASSLASTTALALGHDDDARPEPEGLETCSDVGERQDRLEDPTVLVRRVVLDEHVVRRPDVDVAEPLGDFGRRLDPFGAAPSSMFGSTSP